MTATQERREGRLFTQRLRRSREARAGALATLRLAGVDWTVRIGGPVRGRAGRFPTRRDAAEAVRRHYNAVLYGWLRARWGRP